MILRTIMRDGVTYMPYGTQLQFIFIEITFCASANRKTVVHCRIVVVGCRLSVSPRILLHSKVSTANVEQCVVAYALLLQKVARVIGRKLG